MMIKTVNDEEGTNLRCWGREGFVPNRQEDVGHDEKTRSLSIVNRSGSKSTFELKYRRVNEGYLYESENCRNTRGTRFQGSVLELQMCQVVETLPQRNLRSKDPKGVNSKNAEKTKGDVYSEARKLGHTLVPSVQSVKGVIQGWNSEISEETQS